MNVEVNTDRTHAELNRLFNIYRISNLNVRYYGCRAEKYEFWQRLLNIGIGLLSAAALSILLASDTPGTRVAGAILAGVAAVISALIPFLGWAEKARELRNLNFVYGQIFSQIEHVMTEIRRSETMTDEQLGMARMVHAAFMRVDALDELDPDRKLAARLDKKVREAFPDDYVWTNL